MVLVPPVVMLGLSLALGACGDKDTGDTGQADGGADGGGDGGGDGGTDGGTDGGGDGGSDTLGYSVTLPTEPVDECHAICGSVSVSGPAEQIVGVGFQVESDIDGFLSLTADSDTETDAAGAAAFCVEGPLTPGLHQVAVHFDSGDRTWELGTLDVRPFGWAYGLDKPAEVMLTPDWVPSFSSTQLQAEPVFSWQEGTWASKSVLAPTTVELGGTRFLYFAGTEDDSVFYLGVATATGETGFEMEPDYMLTAAQVGAVKGDWDYYAQNTPEAIVVGDEIWLYYNGRSGTSGGLTIGRAVSTDGVNFERIATPALSPTGDAADFDGSGVAHPSVEVRAVDFVDNEVGAAEVYELWYASGTLEIGYALSADGATFERYCGDSVFSGTSGSWDAGTTKAPEVKVYDGRYYMTYSGCGQGCYEVGWAASYDGIRWAPADAPIIPTQPPQGDGTPSWNSYGTQEAYIELTDDGTWRIWYAGTGNNHASIGWVETRYGE